MKISQISTTSYGSNNLSIFKNNENGLKLAQSQPNFKGLWGKDYYENYSDREYQDEYIRHNYYPFSDETKEDIESVVRAHSNYDSSAADVYDAVTHVISESVIVNNALPFTSKDFA